MGARLLVVQIRWVFSLLVGVLPAVQDIAQETLTRARERYHAGRTGQELAPPVSWLDPDVLASLGPSVPTGRLARLLVEARPMGP
jgi:hypothetical protein